MLAGPVTPGSAAQDNVRWSSHPWQRRSLVQSPLAATRTTCATQLTTSAVQATPRERCPARCIGFECRVLAGGRANNDKSPQGSPAVRVPTRLLLIRRGGGCSIIAYTSAPAAERGASISTIASRSPRPLDGSRSPGARCTLNVELNFHTALFDFQCANGRLVGDRGSTARQQAFGSPG